MTANIALANAARALAETSDTARLDAELLLAHALAISRSDLLLRQRDLAAPSSFAELIARRLAHEPVAYIVGEQDFWNLRLRVTPDVLIPRADSETLIEAASSAFADRAPPKRIIDLGTGSGALLLAALSVFPSAKGTGFDSSQAALAVAAENATRTDLANRAVFRLGSWRNLGWSDGFEPFDLILCNPPYVESVAILAPQVRDYEPASALFAGIDGLNDYRILIPQIPALLTATGMAIFEIGQGQELAVRDLAANVGLNAQQNRDLAGIIRALSMSKRQV